MIIKFMKNLIIKTFFIFLIFPFLLNGQEYQHGIAMHGKLKYEKNFPNFEYSNPDAPKVGKIKLSSIGTFDNLNPYILKGVGAWQMSYVFETLMQSSSDEAFSQYGLLAEGIKVPKDRSWVSFKLRKTAKFSDGSDLTADELRGRGGAHSAKYQVPPPKVPAADAEARSGGRR